MPTRNPRINLTVSPELDLVLTNYAEAIGQPKATAAVGILELCAMQLSATANSIRLARTSPLEALTDAVAVGLQNAASIAQRLSGEVSGAIAEVEVKPKPKSTPKPSPKSKRRKRA